MDLNFSVIEAIERRRSVRNFSYMPVSPEQQEQLRQFLATLWNPFNCPVEFHLLDRQAEPGAQQLGTYGVIQGAQYFVGATVGPDGPNLEALGFEFETVLLFLTQMGLGTCWLGGTFDRRGFAGAMDIDPAQLFPIISPYGYAADKPHLKEKAMRAMIKADQRKDFTRLFFKDDFTVPLQAEEAGPWAVPLEMVRLGPSASNKQPWRILVRDGRLHFYECQSVGYSTAFPYDIQRIDMGIAAAHFAHCARELGLSGRFGQQKPELPPPDHFIYCFSWIPDSPH